MNGSNMIVLLKEHELTNMIKANLPSYFTSNLLPIFVFTETLRQILKK